MTVRLAADGTGRTLMVGGLEASHVDVADPARLAFPYMRRIGDVLDVLARGGRPLRALHLGGGLGTLGRYLAATRPGSASELVEIDAEVAALAREAGLGVEVADARAALERRARRTYDVVIADVFDGPVVPRHLTTRELVADVRRVLRPGGAYVVNLIDDPPHRLARRQVATIAAAFSETLLLAERPVLAGRRTGNLVVAAADRTLPVARLRARSQDVLDREAVEIWCEGARPLRD
jgi:spermidine synthase